jgi:hypothetical protein
MSNYYYELHREEILKSRKVYYAKNKTAKLEYQNEYIKQPDVIIKRKEYMKKRRKTKSYKDNHYISHKKYRQTDSYKVHLEARNKKYSQDPKFRLNHSMSVAIGDALTKNKNGRHWEDLVGYKMPELKQHLENLWSSGMSWNNYGKNGWVIDHIIPRKLWEYKSSNDIEFKQCWCLANLQPLWEIDNIKKGDAC